jgi:hypothetical protein
MARKHNLAEVLQTEITGSMPLKTLAKVLASKGRGRDTVLAHITPKEAELLKKRGGRGSRNPDTGLLEFDDGYTVDFSQAEPVISAPEPTVTQTPTFGGDVRNQAAYGDYYVPTEQPVVAAEQPSLLQQAVSPYSFYNAPNVAGMPSVGYNYDTQQFASTTLPGAPPLSPVDTQVAAQGGGRGDAGVQQLIADAGKSAAVTTPPPADQQQQQQQQKTQDQQKSFLASLSEPKNILGLGIAGAGGLLGYLGQQRAAQQAKAAQAQIAAAYNQAAQQQQQLAQPLIGPGYTQLSQALQGALSPANQQAYQIAQARAAQASARSGGVGAVQAALQEEALRQQLLAGQQAQALALIAPGNTMLQNAIQNQINATTQGLGTSLSLQQQANQAANQMYAALGGAVAGGMLKG